MILAPLACLPLILSAPTTGGLIVVDTTGAGDYTRLEVAIAAASDGDVLLVKSGSYAVHGAWPPPPFVLPDQNLSIVADEGASVQLDFGLHVTGLSAGRRVVLSGLDIRQPLASGAVALRLDGCLGSIRVQDCSVESLAERAVVLQGCADVIFSRSTSTGGTAPADPLFGDGGPGWAGLALTDSRVAAYGCLFRGGAGGDGEWAGVFCGAPGGDGGVGAAVLSGSFLYAMGAEFAGGDGGLGICEVPDGNGNVGLLVLDSEAQLVEPTFSPGSTPGGRVAPASWGGPIVVLDQANRELQGPAVVREGQVSSWTVTGLPGDRVFLPSSSAPAWRWLPPLGVLTLTSPIHLGGQLGVIGPGASLAFNATAPTLPAGMDVDLVHQQVFVLLPSGQRRLGGAQALFVLDSSF